MPKFSALASLLVITCLGSAQIQPRTDAPARQLSLRQAIEIALSPNGNARLQLAEESEVVAREQGRETRAALLPNVSGAVREQRQVVNVAALGVQVQVEGVPVELGESPYSTFDARVYAEQTIFDWSAIRRNQAAHASVQASDAEVKEMRQQTISQVAAAYFAALRAQARVEAAQSDVSLADELANTAERRVSAGQAIGLEATRAGAQLAHARQRLLAAQNESFRARLELCRELGLEPDPDITLTDKLTLSKTDEPTVAQALQNALRARSDLKAQQRRVNQAELSHGQARAESIPSLYGYADYGPLGLTPEAAIETYTVGVGLKIPIFDGGRREAKRAETLSLARQEQIREKDLRAQIAMEVQTALESLQIAAAQVDAAEQGAALAEQELSQARRRYEQGLATSLDIIAGQNRVEQTQDERIAALYTHELARLELARAMGDAMRIVP